MGVCVLCRANTIATCSKCGGICAGRATEHCAGRDGVCPVCRRRPYWLRHMSGAWVAVPCIDPVVKLQSTNSYTTIPIPTEPMLET